MAHRQVSTRRPRRLSLAALILAAALLSSCGDDYAKGAGVYTAPTTTASAPAESPAREEPSQRAGAGGARESSETQPLTTAQRAQVDAASTAARAFLAGYLPYSYGQADARELRAVVPELRDELARHPPRVPTAKSKQARPRLRGLQLSGVDAGRVVLLAQVDDGDSRYAALVTVSQRGRGWQVSEVQ